MGKGASVFLAVLGILFAQDGCRLQLVSGHERQMRLQA